MERVIGAILFDLLVVTSSNPLENAKTKRSFLINPSLNSYYQIPQSGYTDYNHPTGFDNFLESSVFPLYGRGAPRTYIPSVEWPNYVGGFPYPIAVKPSNPSLTLPTTNHPGYLPPQITTTTEFILPEVIDAKNKMTKSSKENSEIKFDNSPIGRNNAYQSGHSNEAVEIIKMNCDNGDVEGRFRAIFRTSFMQKVNVTPVLEDSLGTRIPNECFISEENVGFHLDIPSQLYSTCGVINCSGSEENRLLCVRVRFPTMKNLRLVDDFVVNLRCRIQEPIVTHTKRIEMSVSGSHVADRSKDAAQFATGGATNIVKCNVELLRREPGGYFSRRMQPGATVWLGEELLVRVTIAEGDGWQWSRLGEVSLEEGDVEQGARVTLVTSDGCIVPEASAICPQQPSREAPLVHSLIVRAPMFEGRSTGSTVVLNLRVLACRQNMDCTSTCTRRARSVPVLNQSSKIRNRNDMHAVHELYSTLKQEKESIDDEHVQDQRSAKFKNTSKDIDVNDDVIKARTKRASVEMTVDSVMSIAFKVENKEAVKRDVNSKPILMLIGLGASVFMLTLAVLFVGFRQQDVQAQKGFPNN